jgi:hypothetical protein
MTVNPLKKHGKAANGGERSVFELFCPMLAGHLSRKRRHRVK